MFDQKKITIAIVTKNRSEKLDRLLCSIRYQTELPKKIIIVDNDIAESAKSIAKKYSKYLNIFYFAERNQGVPFARNRALDLVKTKYLAYIDDDCAMEKHWVVNAEKIIAKFPNITYFIGKSDLLNPGNAVSVALHANQRYWFRQMLEKQIMCSPYNADTKNAIYKVYDLKKNKLKFDKNMSMGWFDNADIDMGFAMKKNKLIGIYVEKMKVWHEETTELNYYFKKSYYRGVLAGKLAQKWKLSGQFTDIRLQNWFYYLFSIRKWFREYNNYSKICELKILSFLFIKLSERVFLKGFLTTLK